MYGFFVHFIAHGDKIQFNHEVDLERGSNRSKRRAEQVSKEDRIGVSVRLRAVLNLAQHKPLRRPASFE